MSSPSARTAIAIARELGAAPASFAVDGPNAGLANFRGELLAEAVEQAAVVAVLRAAGVLCFASPAGVKLRPVQAAEVGVLGLEAGFPDLVLPCHRIALEFKAPDRRPKTAPRSPFPAARPEQRMWLAALAYAGWTCRVVFSAREAVELLAELGVLPAPPPPPPPRPLPAWAAEAVPTGVCWGTREEVA